MDENSTVSQEEITLNGKVISLQEFEEKKKVIDQDKVFKKIESKFEKLKK